jgi:hypothetical protein
MTTITRTVRALVLAAAVGGLLGACADEGGDGDDAVASLDDAAAAATDDDGDGDGDDDRDDDGGGGGRPDGSEFQDAALEYAECMRDHGIDMPDPTFDEDGGTRVVIGPGDGSGPELGPDGRPSEEFRAASEDCQPILEEAAPDMQLTPEEQAEMQDQLVAMAECMRARGHDVPDPQVSDDGRVTSFGGPGQGAGPVPGSAEEDDFMQDMEECNEEAGLDGPPGRAGERGEDADGEEEG